MPGPVGLLRTLITMAPFLKILRTLWIFFCTFFNVIFWVFFVTDFCGKLLWQAFVNSFWDKLFVTSSYDELLCRAFVSSFHVELSCWVFVSSFSCRAFVSSFRAELFWWAFVLSWCDEFCVVFCLVLLQVPKHFGLVTNFLCHTKRWFPFIKFGLCAGTKFFEVSLNIIQLLVWTKHFLGFWKKKYIGFLRIPRKFRIHN